MNIHFNDSFQIFMKLEGLGVGSIEDQALAEMWLA